MRTMGDRKGKNDKENIADRMYEVIHTLSDMNRIQIMRLLAEQGELCARDILLNFPITQPTLSHHMNVLLETQLVEARKSGRWVFYRLSPAGLEEIIDFFVNLKNNQASSAPGTKDTADRKPDSVNRRMSVRRTSPGHAVMKKTAARPAAENAEKLLAKSEAKPAASSVRFSETAAEEPSVKAAEPFAFVIDQKKNKDKQGKKDKKDKKEKKKKKNRKK